MGDQGRPSGVTPGGSEAAGDLGNVRAQLAAAQRRLALLAEAGARLVATLDFEAILREVVHLAVPPLADICFVDVVTDDGRVTHLAEACVDPAAERALRELRQRYDANMNPRSPVANALRIGRSRLLPEVPDAVLQSLVRDEPGLQFIRSLGVCSGMVVPLVARGRILGAVVYATTTSRRRYGEEDLALAEDLTRRAALAADNARLYQAERRAREAAEHAVAALRESEQRYRTLVELSPEPMAVHVDGKIAYVNSAAVRLLGASSPDELVGRPALFPLAPERRARAAERLEAIMREGVAAAALEEQIVALDGSTVDVEVTAMPTTYHGQPALQILLRDVTARKEAERQHLTLARSERLRALGEMASGVAHDLNQYLGLVAGHGELALRAVQALRAALDAGQRPDPQGIEDSLRIVTQAAMDGAETVKRVLAFTRPLVEGPAERFPVGELLRDVARLTAPQWRDAAQAGGRPISLTVHTAGDTTMLGWPAALREALTNVIFNAVDALPDGGRIEMRALGQGATVQVEVTDTGMGMAPEVQARVFEPFFTTKGEQGTGLGLALVFRIMEQHLGQISLESAPGLGTTFRFTFPAAGAADDLSGEPGGAAGEPVDGDRSAGEASQAVTVEAPEVPGLRPLRILAVDDEPALARMVALMLGPRGHTVTVATSGEAALVALESAAAAAPARSGPPELPVAANATGGDAGFDLVISDIGMGAGMNGWELAAAVGARYPTVVFCLATGWGAQIEPEEAQARGVAGVISKPYRTADLEKLVALAQPPTQ